MCIPSGEGVPRPTFVTGFQFSRENQDLLDAGENYLKVSYRITKKSAIMNSPRNTARLLEIALRFGGMNHGGSVGMVKTKGHKAYMTAKDVQQTLLRQGWGVCKFGNVFPGQTYLESCPKNKYKILYNGIFPGQPIWKAGQRINTRSCIMVYFQGNLSGRLAKE